LTKLGKISAEEPSEKLLAAKLLHGGEAMVYGDAGYTAANKREELKSSKVAWHIARRRSTVKALPEGELKTLTGWIEHLKAKVRAKVERPFRVIKRQFGHTKVRYSSFTKFSGGMFIAGASDQWYARCVLPVAIRRTRTQSELRQDVRARGSNPSGSCTANRSSTVN
jgi:DNA polymerase II small subunit/DNA polymerase delta subunit B